VPAKEILHFRRGSGGYSQGKGAGMKTPLFEGKIAFSVE